MDRQTAERAADAVLVCAAIAGAAVVWRTPALRRLVWRLAKIAVTRTLPAYLGQEVRAAWAAAGARERFPHAALAARAAPMQAGGRGDRLAMMRG
jgi:hypothetical protein